MGEHSVSFDWWYTHLEVTPLYAVIMLNSVGFGSIVAGFIIFQEASGRIVHFDRLGFVMVGTAVVSVVGMFFVNRMVSQKIARSVAG